MFKFEFFNYFRADIDKSERQKLNQSQRNGRTTHAEYYSDTGAPNVNVAQGNLNEFVNKL